jgi:hypothetical protein
MEICMSSRLLTSLGLLGALAITPALAGSYKFTMHNESQYAISGFETFEDGKWSKWTGVDIPPGQEIGMDWQSDKGDCNVPFRIIYKDIETEQYTVDWCKISHIRVKDDKVTAD